MPQTPDNPISELLNNVRRPFPADIEELICQIASIRASALDELRADSHAWANGQNLDSGRSRLQQILAQVQLEDDDTSDLEGIGEVF